MKYRIGKAWKDMKDTIICLVLCKSNSFRDSINYRMSTFFRKIANLAKIEPHLKYDEPTN